MIALEAFRKRVGEELGRGAWFALVEGFVPDHAGIMQCLIAELPLAPEPLRIFGRDVMTPREVAYLGEPHASYVYSGRLHRPIAWTPTTTALRIALAEQTGVSFDSVLVNHYRDGQDSMGWHADDEPELGPMAPHDVLIASISLGAKRSFRMKPKRGSEPSPRQLMLGEGSLLFMGGSLQREMVHAVPKTKKIIEPRLNLTFRLVRSDAARGTG